ncbi:hypothetical protein [Evansella halocellulosilytica]|uniref:hypothetical protein n=1 Tax=Evansella halocellulosilytica TaxID=2011013 RepID=UPI000BB67D58|nr:hypothetical protein [Evansella halocellulosilytica]
MIKISNCFVLAIIIGIVIFSNYTVYAENDDEILGVLYDDQIHGLNSKSDLDSRLQLEDFSYENGKVFLEGTIDYPNGKLIIESSGEIYDSLNLALKESNAKVIDFKNTDSAYNILSATIEESAFKPLLLPINYDLENKVVLKLAVGINENEQILYFEGELPRSYKKVVEEDSINLEGLISNLDNKESLSFSESKELNNLKEQKDVLFSNENWFFPFVEKEVNPIINEKEGEERNISVQGSIIPDVPDYNFKRVDSRLTTYSNDWGYYKVSTNWPVISENVLTDVIKWVWPIGHIDDLAEGTNVTNNSFLHLQITNDGRYLYLEETGEIVPFADESYIRLDNITLEVVYPNIADIFYSARSFVEVNGSYSFNFSSVIGLLPFGNYYATINNVRNIVTYQEEPFSGETMNFPTTVEAQVNSYQRTIRDLRIDVEDSLRIVGDRAGINYQGIVPQDVSEDGELTYRRSNLSRRVTHQFDFDIYVRNRWGSYTHAETVNKTKNLVYTVE